MKFSAIITALFLFCISINEVHAQTKEDKTWVSAFIGQHDYNGDYGNEFNSFEFPKDIVLGIGVHHYLTPSFDINYNLTFGTLDTERFWKNMFSNNIQAKYKFANGKLFAENAAVKPFATLGLGLTGLTSGSPTVTDNMIFQVPMGVGVEIPVNDDLDFIVQSTYNRTFYDRIDGNTTIDDRNHDDVLTHTIGVKFNLFKKRDGDGVRNNIDLCVDEAGTEATMGCPDTDGDLVADKDDLCPETAGLAAFSGCPDTDGDGVEDSEDACPTIAGESKFNGCTDSDSDGIADPKDACPNVAGLEATMGCPDNDKDGIINSKDNCPEAAGSEKNGGCPDSDNDGVLDKDDDCPNEVGAAGNLGCPGVSEEVKEQLDVIFKNLVFGNNSSEIDASSLDDMDTLASIMAKDSSLRLVIEGYTDSRGREDYNKQLSQSRADAVKTYLINKGISQERITSIGYGEAKPIDTNETAEGRNNNRRVELNLSYE